jgi:hypothetical protein
VFGHRALDVHDLPNLASPSAQERLELFPGQEVIAYEVRMRLPSARLLVACRGGAEPVRFGSVRAALVCGSQERSNAGGESTINARLQGSHLDDRGR